MQALTLRIAAPRLELLGPRVPAARAPRMTEKMKGCSLHPAPLYLDPRRKELSHDVIACLYHMNAEMQAHCNRAAATPKAAA